MAIIPSVECSSLAHQSVKTPDFGDENVGPWRGCRTPSYRTSVAARCGWYQQTATNTFLPSIAGRGSRPRTSEDPRPNGQSLAGHVPKDGSPPATPTDNDCQWDEIRGAGSHSGRSPEMSV